MYLYSISALKGRKLTRAYLETNEISNYGQLCRTVIFEECVPLGVSGFVIY